MNSDWSEAVVTLTQPEIQEYATQYAHDLGKELKMVSFPQYQDWPSCGYKVQISGKSLTASLNKDCVLESTDVVPTFNIGLSPAFILPGW